MNDTRIVEDIAYLRKVVEDSRRVVVDNGIHLLSWGILVVVGMLLTYASVNGVLRLPPLWIWIVVIGLGWMVSMWSAWRETKRARTRTFINRVLGSVWLGLGFIMTVIGFLGPATGATSSWAAVPLMSLILGAGLLATATIHQERLLVAAAAGWWAGGIVTMLFPGDYALLLFAGMMIVFQIAPGVKLYKKWQKETESARS